jgi:hypothetical protein
MSAVMGLVDSAAEFSQPVVEADLLREATAEGLDSQREVARSERDTPQGC